MGKFDGLLLCSDFDDTLYDRQLRIPQRNIQAISYFQQQGGRFSVVTGRAHRTFAPYAHLVEMNAPAVLSNGSVLYDFQADRLLDETFLSPDAPEDFQKVCDAFPEVGFEAYYGEEIYVFRPNWVTRLHMKKVGADCVECREIKEIPTPWNKVIFQQEHETMVRVQRWMLERWADKYEAIFSNRLYLEITDQGSDKGGAVERLAALLGVSRVYCVGDNQNDIPMLRRSAIPFAPANCAREVREFGARVLCHCDDGVIGDIVEILDQIYK